MAIQFIHEAGQQINGTTALITAATRRSIDVARLIVEKEAKMADSNGWTALMWAEDT